jgi:hypothetical protein
MRQCFEDVIRTQARLQLLHVSPLWTTLLSNFIVSAIMTQARARSTAWPFPITSELPPAANDARNALGSGNIVAVSSDRAIRQMAIVNGRRVLE